MADSESHKKTFGYFAYKKDKKLKFKGFWQNQDLQSLRDWGNGVSSKEAVQVEDHSHVDETNTIHPFMKSVTRIVESDASQIDLIGVAPAAQHIFSRVVAETEVVKPIQKNCPIIEENDNYVIHSLDEEEYRTGTKARRRLERFDKGLDALPGAVLMSIIASFESLQSDIIGDMLRQSASRYASGQKLIKVGDVLSKSSFEEVIDQIISEELYDFFRGSHADQIKFIDNNFQIGIKNSWKRYPDFIEVFERRNLVAHGEQKFTDRYVRICTENGHKGASKLLGQSIKLRPDYLKQALDLLSEFNILLIFSFWRKNDKHNEVDIFRYLNHSVYELIVDRRNLLAARLIEYALSLKGTSVTEEVRLMMIVNQASAYRNIGDKDKVKSILDSVDWTAASPKFRISVAALRDEMQEVCDLMQASVLSGDMSKEGFRDWPVFSFVRDRPEFRSKYEETFSEPLPQSVTDDQDDEDIGLVEDVTVDKESDDKKTMH